MSIDMETSTTPLLDLQVRVRADNDDDSDDYSALSTIELRRKYGIPPQHPRSDQPRSPKRVPQGAMEREALQTQYDDALGTISEIEAQAGPTLRRALIAAKGLQADYQYEHDRKGMALRRLSWRKGLLRLMQVEFHCDFPHEVTDRSRLYVQVMLQVSASVAALTGTGWGDTLRWFESHLPALTLLLSPDRLHRDFERYVSQAHTELNRRASAQLRPTPGDIAEALQITLEQLRVAEANRSGLTSIDRQTRQERDRERKERHRRDAGMKPQSERTKTAELEGLARQLGCSLRTVQRHAAAGTLEAFIAGRATAVIEVSPVIENPTGGQICDTANADAPTVLMEAVQINPAADSAAGAPAEGPLATDPPAQPLTVTGYQGRNLILTPEWVAHYLTQYPSLNDNARLHFDQVDAKMSKTPEPYKRVVARNLIRDQVQSAWRMRKAAA